MTARIRRLARLATFSVAALLFAPHPAAANDLGDSTTHEFLGVCFVQANGTDPARTISTTDWYLVHAGVPNQGTTQFGFLPCLPLTCPDGFTLVSTACFDHDPFDHVPSDQPVASSSAGASEATSGPASPLPLEVGPLVEPPIPTNHTSG